MGNAKCLKIIGDDIRERNSKFLREFCEHIATSNVEDIDLESINKDYPELELLIINADGNIDLWDHTIKLSSDVTMLTSEFISKISNNKPVNILLSSCFSSAETKSLAHNLSEEQAIITTGKHKVYNYHTEKAEANILKEYFYESNNFAQSFLNALPYLAGIQANLVTKYGIFNGFELAKKFDHKKLDITKETAEKLVFDLDQAVAILEQIQFNFINFINKRPQLNKLYGSLTPVTFQEEDALIFARDLFLYMYLDIDSYSNSYFENFDQNYINKLSFSFSLFDREHRIIFETALKRADFLISWSIRHDHADLLEILIERKGGLNITMPRFTVPVLQAACICGSYQVVRLLIEKGADVNEIHDSNGWMAIHYAAEGYYSYNVHRTGIVEYLVDNGTYINAKTKDGLNSLSIALSNGNIDTALFLLTKGIEVNQEGLIKNAVKGLRIAQGKQQFYNSSINDNTEESKSINFIILKKLFDLGVKPTAKDLDEIFSGSDVNTEMAHILLSNIDEHYEIKESALNEAIKLNRLELLNFWLERCDINDFIHNSYKFYKKERLVKDDSLFFKFLRAQFKTFTTILDNKLNIPEEMQNDIFWLLSIYRPYRVDDTEKLKYFLSKNVTISNEAKYESSALFFKKRIDDKTLAPFDKEYFNNVRDIIVNYCSQLDNETGEIRDCYDLLVRTEIIGQNDSCADINSLE